MPYMPIVPPQASPDLIAKVQQLEAALSKSMSLLQLLMDKLETRLGPAFLGPELAPLLEIGRHAEEQIAQIDRLVKEHKQPEAARVLRELSGATWDQAHQITKRWSFLRPEKKVQWLRFHQWSHQLLQSEGQVEAADGNASEDGLSPT